VQSKRTAEAIVEVPTNPGGGSVLRETTNAQQPTQPSPTIQPSTTSRRFVVGGGPPTRVLLPVVAVNTTASVVTAQGDTNVKVWFEACQNSGRLNNTAMLHKDISSYVRYDLFPNLKFMFGNQKIIKSPSNRCISRPTMIHQYSFQMMMMMVKGCCFVLCTMPLVRLCKVKQNW
jgi:hypothetical protein